MLPKSVQNLINEFTKLPGIGPRMAARLTFYLLAKPESVIQSLASALEKVTSGLKACLTCGNLSEEEECSICRDPSRQDNIICVVEEPLDVVALERSDIFRGRYHVLGGVISPINGVGPEHLRIEGLMERVKRVIECLPRENVSESRGLEVILATNPSLEGEATASYLTDHLNHLPIKITRIARGLPVGSEIEFADPTTLSRALEGRREIR